MHQHHRSPSAVLISRTASNAHQHVRSGSVDTLGLQTARHADTSLSEPAEGALDQEQQWKQDGEDRRRRVEQEMRSLAEKETAARQEKADALRQEMEDTMRTRQRLLQNAKERRMRRAQRSRGRAAAGSGDSDHTFADTSMSTDADVTFDCTTMFATDPADGGDGFHLPSLPEQNDTSIVEVAQASLPKLDSSEEANTLSHAPSSPTLAPETCLPTDDCSLQPETVAQSSLHVVPSSDGDNAIADTVHDADNTPSAIEETRLGLAQEMERSRAAKDQDRRRVEKSVDRRRLAVDEELRRLEEAFERQRQEMEQERRRMEEERQRMEEEVQRRRAAMEEERQALERERLQREAIEKERLQLIAEAEERRRRDELEKERLREELRQLEIEEARLRKSKIASIVEPAFLSSISVSRSANVLPSSTASEETNEHAEQCDSDVHHADELTETSVFTAIDEKDENADQTYNDEVQSDSNDAFAMRQQAEYDGHLDVPFRAIAVSSEVERGLGALPLAFDDNIAHFASDNPATELQSEFTMLLDDMFSRDDQQILSEPTLLAADSHHERKETSFSGPASVEEEPAPVVSSATAAAAAAAAASPASSPPTSVRRNQRPVTAEIKAEVTMLFDEAFATESDDPLSLESFMLPSSAPEEQTQEVPVPATTPLPQLPSSSSLSPLPSPSSLLSQPSSLATPPRRQRPTTVDFRNELTTILHDAFTDAPEPLPALPSLLADRPVSGILPQDLSEMTDIPSAAHPQLHTQLADAPASPPLLSDESEYVETTSAEQSADESVESVESVVPPQIDEEPEKPRRKRDVMRAARREMALRAAQGVANSSPNESIAKPAVTGLRRRSRSLVGLTEEAWMQRRSRGLADFIGTAERTAKPSTGNRQSATPLIAEELRNLLDQHLSTVFSDSFSIDTLGSSILDDLSPAKRRTRRRSSIQSLVELSGPSESILQDSASDASDHQAASTAGQQVHAASSNELDSADESKSQGHSPVSPQQLRTLSPPAPIFSATAPHHMHSSSQSISNDGLHQKSLPSPPPAGVPDMQQSWPEPHPRASVQTFNVGPPARFSSLNGFSNAPPTQTRKTAAAFFRKPASSSSSTDASAAAVPAVDTQHKGRHQKGSSSLPSIVQLTKGQPVIQDKPKPQQQPSSAPMSSTPPQLSSAHKSHAVPSMPVAGADTGAAASDAGAGLPPLPYAMSMEPPKRPSAAAPLSKPPLVPVEAEQAPQPASAANISLVAMLQSRGANVGKQTHASTNAPTEAGQAMPADKGTAAASASTSSPAVTAPAVPAAEQASKHARSSSDPVVSTNRRPSVPQSQQSSLRTGKSEHTPIFRTGSHARSHVRKHSRLRNVVMPESPIEEVPPNDGEQPKVQVHTEQRGSPLGHRSTLSASTTPPAPAESAATRASAVIATGANTQSQAPPAMISVPRAKADDAPLPAIPAPDSIRQERGTKDMSTKALQMPGQAAGNTSSGGDPNMWERLPPWNQILQSDRPQSAAGNLHSRTSSSVSLPQMPAQSAPERPATLAEPAPKSADSSSDSSSRVSSVLEAKPYASSSSASSLADTLALQPARSGVSSRSKFPSSRSGSIAAQNSPRIGPTVQGVTPSMITGRRLEAADEKSPLAVLATYLTHFNFTETSIDLALRSLFLELPLPREPEKVDYILIAFASRFFECNPDMFPSPDAVYSIAFAILLLHTNVHGNAKRPMSFDHFFSQANAIDKANPTAPEVLEILHDNIISSRLTHAGDQSGAQAAAASAAGDGQGIFSRLLGRRPTINGSSSPDRFLQQANKARLSAHLPLPDSTQFTYRPDGRRRAQSPDVALQRRCALRVSGLRASASLSPQSRSIEYMLRPPTDADDASIGSELICAKHDLVWRKLDQLQSGQRSGHRSWVQHWIALCGTQLLVFSDVAWFRDPANRGSPSVVSQSGLPLPYMCPAPRPVEICSLKDAICVVDRNYQKHPHAFRLCFPDGQQWMLRASSEQEFADWMFKINAAAAYRSVDLDMATPGESTDARRGARARYDAVSAKVLAVSRCLAELEHAMTATIRLHLQISVTAPVRRKTRDRAMAAGRALNFRLRQNYIELQRLTCYHEMLEAELSTLPLPSQMKSASSSSQTSLRKKSHLVSQSLDSLSSLQSADTSATNTSRLAH
ncbi:hypothetical protein THASP1DRAFT_27155 [Thamnocephalis sphaerospora]|uniref:SEC7 domain-containing protein n=1 Tax=Thamnocephalis sphaerospora TaxID=78915 RepID=A0A4P9XXF7_9FUNG|nr:hypothetical protein THASP1DRAFT_27155 [Thamnocephalis sphaerospora]|eukprot:RKP11056.1 hypothetical protein THASP1DRAFT_27155 [Thamnocephalis sphaerospora]